MQCCVAKRIPPLAPRKVGPKTDQSRDPETGLTPLQMKLLPLLLQSTSYAEASAKAGLNPDSLSQIIRRDTIFRNAIHQARRDAYAHTLWCAQEAAYEALQVFRDGMKHKDFRIRISAAKEIASMARAGFEGLDMNERMARLESIAQPTVTIAAPAA